MKMNVRPLAIGIPIVAILASSMVGLATPAFAAADVAFSPTTNLNPGTSLSNVVVSTSSGALCQSDDGGTETTTGTTVYFGVDFYDSADQTYDSNDSYIGYAEGPSTSYTSGSTSSAAFQADVPVLNRHNSANYIVAVGYCYDDTTYYSVDHGDGVVVTYSDLTFPTPNVAQGATATAHIIDATSPGQFCDTQGNTGPFSVGLEFYSSWDAYFNDDDPVVMLPAAWSQGSGPGLGSFEAADLPNGVNVDFVVPSDLPVGDYQVYAFCIASDGYSAGDSMGLQPFSVTAALPSTGPDAQATIGWAAGGVSLLLAGFILWAIRRRATKA